MIKRMVNEREESEIEETQDKEIRLSIRSTIIGVYYDLRRWGSAAENSEWQKFHSGYRKRMGTHFGAQQ